MAGEQHVPGAVLSAYLDGELDAGERAPVARHLAACANCSAQVAAFAGIDQRLAEPPRLACREALELRSALLDQELSPTEAGIAAAHLAGCAICRSDDATWLALDHTLLALPAGQPSATTDRRIGELTRRHPPVLPTPVGPAGIALRGALTAGLVVAIVTGLIPSGQGQPEVSTPSEGEALVSAVQQVVLYPRTNTLFVISAAAAAVDARDAATYALRSRITVGGRPMALALHEARGQLLVLDAQERSLTYIDANTHKVLAQEPLEVAGKPTSVQVDRDSGKIVVSAIPDPPTTRVVPRPTTATRPAPAASPAKAGMVAVIDPTTRKLETIASVDVTPSLVVIEPSGGRTLLVSTQVTRVVDGSFKTLADLPGGIAATFAATGPTFALLSAESGDAVLRLFGGAPTEPLRLPGIPLAVTSLPGGGFAVLVGSAGKSGHIVVVDESGRSVATTEDRPDLGGDLAYDSENRRFAVVRDGQITSVAYPAGLAVASPEASPRSAGPLPQASAPASAAPSQPAAPSDTPVPDATSPGAFASPAPSAVATPDPSASPEPAATPHVVAPGTLRVALSEGRMPLLTAASLKRVWFLDERNALSSLDIASGEVSTLAHLPAEARISALAEGASAVYAVDGGSGDLHTLSLSDEILRTTRIPFLRNASSLIVAPDGVIWAGVLESGQLVKFDPARSRIEVVDVGVSGVAALAMDGRARLWFSDGERLIGHYDLRTDRYTHFLLPSRGSARHLLPEPTGGLLVGTTAGEVLSVSDAGAEVLSDTGWPITALALDPSGVAWYLTPDPQAGRSRLAPVRGGEARPIAGPVSSLGFGLKGRAWLGDVSGAFLLLDAPAR